MCDLDNCMVCLLGCGVVIRWPGGSEHGQELPRQAGTDQDQRPVQQGAPARRGQGLRQRTVRGHDQYLHPALWRIQGGWHRGQWLFWSTILFLDKNYWACIKKNFSLCSDIKSCFFKKKRLKFCNEENSVHFKLFTQHWSNYLSFLLQYHSTC